MNKNGILAVIAFTVVFLLIEVVWLSPMQKKQREWLASKRQHDAWLAKKRAFEAEKKKQEGNGEKKPDQNPDGTAPPTSETKATEIKPETPPPDATPGPRKDFLEKLQTQKTPSWTLDAPTFQATLSSKGGAVEALEFKEIKESSFKPITGEDKKDLAPFRPLRLYDDRVRTLALRSHALELGLENAEWLHTEVALPSGQTAHRFEYVPKTGDLVITKEFQPSADKGDYHLTLRVSVENRGTTDGRFSYELFGPAGIVEPTSCRPQGIQAELYLRDSQGGLAQTKGDALALVKGGKDKKLALQATPQANTKIAFFGLGTKYFTAVVIPRGEQNLPASVSTATIYELAGREPTPAELKQAEAFEDSIAREATTVAYVPEFSVPAGQTVSQEYALYVGPKSDTIFSANPIYEKAGLRELAKYGSSVPGADFLAGILTWILFAFHQLTKSWGASIILLTLFVRACLHPLMVKQTRSSLKMQALGPETAKLKAKYEDKDGKMSPENQRRFQSENWELMRKHGVNPLGCVGPIFFQFPIFIGLWAALSYAFELRQSPFLWIRDLSEPDVIARLPFALPFQGTNALCILPFVMLVVYIVQMRNMPKPTDPNQAESQKVMNWMMPVFGYMFYKFPSGLLLYYITSSSLGMIEQRWIKKRLATTEGSSGKSVPVKV